MKFLIIFIFLSIILNAQSVIINEIVTSNSTFQDSEGDTPDWIEIYNPADTAINLHNYSLSDNLEKPRKWIFPNIELSGNQYLLVYASEKDSYDFELHTNFKLASEGENIILTDSTGFIIDQVDSLEVFPNYSIGRNYLDLSEWLIFPIPTPGKINNTIGYEAITKPPKFSLNSGFFESAVTVNLSSNSNKSFVYYTLDGSEPDRNSFLYSNPITISETTVLRIRAYEENLLPSKILTNTYFINVVKTLPVVSLATNPDNFWDDEIGIYVVGTNGIAGPCNGGVANYYQDWERPIHIEFFENDRSSAFSIDASVKIHGQCSRALNQKSLAITAKSEYGHSSIPYKIFNDRPFEDYNSIILRSSGNDNGSTLFRDALTQSLVRYQDIETQSYRPCIVYLNGEYFGIHNIRERMNEDYYYQHHELGNYGVDVLTKNNTIKIGSNDHYNNLYDFIMNNNLSNEENYKYVTTQMDIENYITYMLSEMYCANIDWYPTNTKFWRPKKDDGKWRWLLFDTDYGYGLFYPETTSKNMLSLVQQIDKYPSVVFNGLISNIIFKKMFINRFADLANTSFKSEIAISKIDEFKNGIKDEITSHIAKWGSIGSLEKWEENVNGLKHFANNRLPNMYLNFINEFALSGIADLRVQISDSTMGYIQLNSIDIYNSIWSGKYFQNIPITLIAIPKAGYKFVGWSGDTTSTQHEIIFNPKEDNNLIAKFEKIIPSNENSIVINEINYNSADNFNTEDWIELYNITDTIINLSGWYLSDEDDEHKFYFPEETNIVPNEYLVVLENDSSFLSLFPDVFNYTSKINFGFSGSGELIRLFDSQDFIVDSLTYDDAEPWPIEADGNGSSLELTDPFSDNSLSENWAASIYHGTPGKANSVLISVNKDEVKDLPTEFKLDQNFPNPFNPTTTINYSLSNSCKVKLSIFDILGREIEVLVDDFKLAGYYKVTWDASNFSSGIYFYKIIADDFVSTKKLILIK